MSLRQRARRVLLLDWGLDLRPVRAALVGGVAFSALRAVLQWIAPVPLKLIFDSVLGAHPLPSFLSWLPASPHQLLVALCVWMLVIALLLGLSSLGANALLSGAGQRVIFDVRRRLFGHFLAQGQGYFRRREAGDLLSRLGGDVQAMQGVVVNVVPVVVENGLTVLGMLVIMLALDWQFSVLALSVLPLMWLVMRHYLTGIKRAQRVARTSEGQATASAQRTLQSMLVVQAFGSEAEEEAHYGRLADQGLSANRHAVVLQARFTPLVSILMTASTSLVLLVGANQVLSGRLTAGDLLLFSAYFRGMYTPARQLSKLAGMLGKGQASAERVIDVLNDDERVPSRARRVPARRSQGALSFENVSVRRPGAEGEILAGVSLELAPGTRHALVGSTGAGKSTLLRLVPRFEEPSAGVVRLDGWDVADLDLTWLRRQIALVPQEIALVRPTVWENVVYGSSASSPADAEAAARRAGVHEVLEGLRDGYATDVGEGGMGLSGGQRQCVAIARAMARDAPVVLLDEPMTGLDGVTQSVVREALERLCEARTTLIVTHHLDLVQHVDEISVLSHGSVIERGSHHQLLSDGAHYRRLHGVAHPPARKAKSMKKSKEMKS